MSPWVAAILGLVALVEAGVIAALVMRQPAAPAPVVAAASEPVAPAAPADTGLRTPIPEAERAAPEPPSRTAAAPPPADPIADANRQRSGGVTLQTPIELKVLQGDRVLGSTDDGPIIMRDGTYQLDLINTSLGLRMRQPITFRAGQMAKLTVTLPNGRVSVNAQPWANVIIDSRDYGETPLANLSVPIGEHDFVFRHPELGERRQRVTVRADGPTRVSVNLEK